MGMIYADLTLKNGIDVGNAQRGSITEKDIHEVTVRALVDTGAGTLVISEALMQQLGLKVQGLRRASLANNARALCKLTEPVAVHWKDRTAVCRALVVPETPEVLLGAIPLEEMDLVINPAKQTLEGAHGEEVITYIL